ncbi:RNase h domain protein [Colletotrichum kahawae]|uniref:Ribonuclease H n=1 Tax=Colletotrichum kahawae TaxID=34407 RepID=A0AAE0D990_COLKA|nr:RNase h domain protein [Colletotrichum kahawae]
MPAKRTASAMADATKSKKRKDEKKWYAVKVGLRPGVYETWDECSENTNHQRGAVYKSFTSKEDAEAFVAGKKIPNRGGKAEPIKYYAVARGLFTGIFHDWDEASQAIYKSTKPKYKKFDTLGEAVRFIKEWGDEDTIDKVQALVDGDSEFESEADEDEDDSLNDQLEPGLIHIYTDGSCLGNGKDNATGGVGVWFGDDDIRNVSERLEGRQQTNQRAELTGVLRALEKTPVTQGAQILTDSRYSINCVRKWAPTWKKKGWKASTLSNDVSDSNKDLVQAVMNKIAEREAKGTRTVFTWVKGHSSSKGNKQADALARGGAEGKGETLASGGQGRAKTLARAGAYNPPSARVQKYAKQQADTAAPEPKPTKTRKKLKTERQETPELNLQFDKEETPDLDEYSDFP